MTKALKKITAKNVGAKAIGSGFTIIGRVARIRNGSTQYGDFTFFDGAFEAVNIATGEVFASAVAILPATAERMIANAVQFAQDKDKSATVEFGLKIQKVAAENAMGQEWEVTPLIEPERESDPLAQLRATVQKALPAPATGPEAEAPKTEKAAKGKK